MTGKPLNIEQILTILAVTPPQISSLTTGLEPDQLHIPPVPGEWSARDVLAHLRACGDVWGKHIMMILTEEKPTIRGINPRVWIKKTDYLEQEFQLSFQVFTRQRSELLSVLGALPHEAWFRTGVVIDTVGKQFERDVLHYADNLARQERSYVRQMEQIISLYREKQ